MSQLLASLESADSHFVRGFAQYCRSQGCSDAAIIEGMQKGAAAFPAIQAEFDKSAIDWRGIASGIKNFGIKAVKAAPKAMAATDDVAAAAKGIGSEVKPFSAMASKFTRPTTPVTVPSVAAAVPKIAPTQYPNAFGKRLLSNSDWGGYMSPLSKQNPAINLRLQELGSRSAPAKPVINPATPSALRTTPSPLAQQVSAVKANPVSKTIPMAGPNPAPVNVPNAAQTISPMAEAVNRPNYLRGALPGALGGAATGAVSAYGEKEPPSALDLGLRTGIGAGLGALGGRAYARGFPNSGGITRGIAGAAAGGALAPSIARPISNAFKSSPVSSDQQPQQTQPQWQLDEHTQQMVDTFKADPQQFQDFNDSLGQYEHELIGQLQEGKQLNPQDALSLMHGHAISSAITANKDPVEFLQDAQNTFDGFMKDKVISPQEFQQIVQTDSGKEAVQTVVDSLKAQGQPISLQNVTSYMQDMFANHPEQLMAALIGIPLALAGAFNMLSGEGGPGSLLMLLGGAAAGAYGLGAYGGGKPVWQDIWNQMTGGQKAPEAEVPTPGSGTPPADIQPAGMTTADGKPTMLSMGINDPQAAYARMQTMGETDANVKNLLHVINNPEEVKAFANAYHISPDQAREYLNQQIKQDTMIPFVNTPAVGPVSDAQWNQIHQALGQPS